MMSINLCWNAIIATSLLSNSFAHAGYSAYQEPVHFARTSTSSSSTQSVTSSQHTTSATTYQSFAINQPGAEVESFLLTRDGVSCHYRSYGQRGSGKSSNGSNAAGSARPPRPLANLNPFDCHVQCPPRTSMAPNKRDCQKVINAMKYAKPRSITLEPHTIFSVEYKSCAVVFENSSSQNVAVIYGWRRLTQQAARLQNQCSSASYSGSYSSRHQSQSNGVCFFSSCDVDKSIQSFGSDKGSLRPSSQSPQNSGIMITFQRKRLVNQ